MCTMLRYITRASLFVALLPAMLAPAAAADAAAGKTKAAKCTVCHGLDGLAKNPDAPNLAGDSANYIRKQLDAYKNGERKDPQMSIMAKGLSDEDIADLAAWYSSLKVTVEMPK
jgi:cytochrome c553